MSGSRSRKSPCVGRLCLAVVESYLKSPSDRVKKLGEITHSYLRFSGMTAISLVMKFVPLESEDVLRMPAIAKEAQNLSTGLHLAGALDEPVHAHYPVTSSPQRPGARIAKLERSWATRQGSGDDRNNFVPAVGKPCSGIHQQVLSLWFSGSPLVACTVAEAFAQPRLSKTKLGRGVGSHVDERAVVSSLDTPPLRFWSRSCESCEHRILCLCRASSE
eukprot:781865-Amphidinium_carterae.1